jgi:myosin heavy subunit
LNYLVEKRLIKELYARYKNDIIYTYIGEVLISINPFKNLNIYTEQDHEAYTNVRLRRGLKPHIFWIADVAYQHLLAGRTSQCIVVSGESGAGKTESTKLMVEHIIHLCRNDVDKELQKKIIEVNELLEAFGNAQTCMNNNSSRFGKYLQMFFTADGHILGGLENSLRIFQLSS